MFQQGQNSIGGLTGGLDPYANQINKTVPVERDTVGSALQRQAMSIGDLHGALDELEKRLTPVLGPFPADQAAGAGQMPPKPDTIRWTVEEHTGTINIARQRVSRLLDRLEL